LRPVPDWLTRWEYAHRGVHSCEVLENSLEAAMIAKAGDLGVECDIQLSRDRVPLVFHDWDLLRLKGRAEQVADLSADELQDIGIMPLSVLLEIVADKIPLLIEIKSKPGFLVESACEAVNSYLDPRSDAEVAVMSFDPRVAVWFHQYAPEIPVGLVMREDSYGYTQTQKARERAFDEADPDFLAYHVVALSNPWVAELREDGLPVLTWTVNSPETRANALKFADALISEGEGLA
jgi:glycerophosphoryl diester phosphodiesterase